MCRSSVAGNVYYSMVLTAMCTHPQPLIKTPSPTHTRTALAVADAEFAGDGDPSTREAALALLQVLHGVRAHVAAPGVSVWLAAVAVVVQDMNTLAAVRDADRELWNKFATVVIEDTQFEAHAHVVRLIHLDGLVEGRLSAGALRIAEKSVTTK